VGPTVSLFHLLSTFPNRQLSIPCDSSLVFSSLGFSVLILKKFPQHFYMLNILNISFSYSLSSLVIPAVLKKIYHRTQILFGWNPNKYHA
jgi:hypothetical protein